MIGPVAIKPAGMGLLGMQRRLDEGLATGTFHEIPADRTGLVTTGKHAQPPLRPLEGDP